jgi:lysophospholipid acyltransferase (LPLAT)-like uncharacterized protein
MMKLDKPWMQKLAGGAAARLGRAVLSTLEFKAVSCDPTTDPAHPKCDQRYLYVTWHECIIVGLPLRSHANMLGIASAHRDGEVLNQMAIQLGWKMVRGSTTLGSVSALKRMVRENERHLNIAPDGPSGPRRKLAPGAIYLASKAGLPLICCAYGFDRPWRLNSWDRCVIPRPFSRARAIFGPPLTIPKKLDRAGLEHFRSAIEQLMNQLTWEAECWAESGQKKPKQFRLQKSAIHGDLVEFPRRFSTPLSQTAASLVDSLPGQTVIRPALRPTCETANGESASQPECVPVAQQMKVAG